jgi:hypothetical protein
MAMRAMFIVYSTTGFIVWVLYRHLPAPHLTADRTHVPLGPSRRIVTHLALLFSVDAFASGLLVKSLLTL